MSLLKEVIKIITRYSKDDSISEDDLFDLQTEVAEKVKDEEFPDLLLNRHDSGCEEALWMAVEGYVGEVTELIRHEQNDLRTKKMAKAAIKRARRILRRITNGNPVGS